jgi:L-iditol 2-dehydrogenase
VQAAVFHGVGDVRIEELPEPVPGPGEVVVELAACGVCGTDLMDWYTATKAPAVLGHEPVGVVIATGAHRPDTGLPPVGARVFMHHHVPCLRCARCRAGRHTLCTEFRRNGLQPGGFAERILVAADHAAADLLEIPAHLPDETATLVEPLACCLRGQRRAGVGPDTRLLVLGLGQAGLLQVQAAIAAGCIEVAGVDPLPERRRLAASYGASVADPGVADRVLDGPPTVVIVCTHADAAVARALDVVDAGGIVQLYAPAAPGHAFALDSADLFFREVTIQFTYSAGPSDTREALALLSEGRVTGAGMVTHRFPLTRLADAMATARTADAVRVVVTGPAAR